MDRLRCLQVFAEVARCGSFIKASVQLSLSKATVTKYVAALEAQMGTQLLKRNSKHLALTEAGTRVLRGGRELLDRYEALEGDVRDAVLLPRGEIRIGTPPSFGAYHLTRVLAHFTHHYPDIEVTMVYDDGRSDLVAEALDLSIRIAPTLDDASYVAVPLLRVPQSLVAAPRYLLAHGTPLTPQDLRQHNCLVHTVKSASGIWRFSGAESCEVKVRGSIRSNLGDSLKEAALMGAGISLHPHYMVADALQQGTLQAVLPEYRPEELDISLVFSTRRNMTHRVRHLIEFLKEWAQNPPGWASSAETVWRLPPAPDDGAAPGLPDE